MHLRAGVAAVAVVDTAGVRGWRSYGRRVRRRPYTGYDRLPLTDVKVLDVRRPESAAPRDVAADARIAIRGKLTCASSASRTR